ncbi:N-6 DNA methylase [Planomonospora parontospora]|uniref:N-6 DNA methylase n=1 Tax=Planomonospora parontospora TaxID=58119 RepID=UPI001941B99B|nr:N-6 DNA methylase [Planomonospora parontospora]GGL37808.1 type II restriction endonuclease subunit M [Planomonospora parontospora subsp. antibiotica]GII17536.1 type II restriction endonuclease subunit M [Planomonospora parontospora subsp. antibiotica]
MATQDGPTVTSGDIARLAGVGRAAVSNWRRRFGDFPGPVGGTASSPLFSLAEVEAWLRAQGRLEEFPEDELLWQQVRNSADDLRLLSLVSRLAAAVAHRRLRTLLEAGDAEVADALPDLVVGDEDVPLIRAAAALAEVRGPEETVEFLYTRYTQAHARRVQAVSPEVAGLMAAFVEPRAAEVFDPSCGHGGLLIAAGDPGAVRAVGQERDGDAARLAGARLAVRGITADIRRGDALTGDAFPLLQADAVLCSPPFSERGWGYEELAGDPRWQYGLPPRGESELAWVQHCLAHARPGGQVIVLMPPAAAGRRSGRRIRSRFIRTGALRAIVALPPGSAPQSAMPPHLWVLRRPDDGDPVPTHVLMIDATESRDSAVPAWRSFVEDPRRETSGSRAVPVIDLLDEDVDLTPARHLARPAAIAGGAGRTADELLSAVAELTRLLPSVTETPHRPLSAVPLSELARTGALSVVQTPGRMETGRGDLALLTAEDLILGRAATGRGADGPGLVVAGPGDVVVPVTGRTPAAAVVEEETALGPHLLLIRPDPGSFDPHFVAGFLRASAARAAGSAPSASRPDARRMRLPRLPLAEQRRYGQVFRELDLFADALRRTGETGELLRGLVLDGLVDGALRPDPRS